MMPVEDSDYLYNLCEITMRVYVEEVWGSWNESETRKHLSDALNRGVVESILENGLRIGAVSVEKHGSHYQLEQIYIEPSHQNRGLGETVVKKVIAKAVIDSLPVKLRVLRPNPAKRLYERLGFVVSDSTKERYFMEFQSNY